MPDDDPIEIVDAHHHLWAPESDPAGVGWVWLRQDGAKPFGDPAPIRCDYLLPEFLAEPSTFRIAASVHIQVDNALPDPVAETHFVDGLARAAGHAVAIVGLVDLGRPDARDVLDRHRATPTFRGVRQILSRDDDDPDRSYAPVHHLRDPLWREQFGLLSEMGLTFDLQLLPAQMGEAVRFLEAHPGVPVVVDHMGSPASDGDDRSWREGMTALAALPNLHVKLSGYGMAFGCDLGAQAADRTVELLALFGAHRTMFGSNFPVDKLFLDYDGIAELILASCGTVADRDAVLRETAMSFYGPSEMPN